MPPAKGSPQSWISQGMGFGAPLPSDSPGWTGGHSLDQDSEARQECGLHTSSPRRNSTRTSMNSWKIKFKRTFPVSWSHCLSTFLPSPLVSLVLVLLRVLELPEWGMKRAVPKISGGAALWASASTLSAWWPEPWTQLPAMSPVGLLLGSEANHLQAGTTKHQGSFFEGNRGPGPVSGSSPLVCGAVGLKAPVRLGWAGLLTSALPRSGRPPIRSGPGCALARVGPQWPLFLQESL